MAVTENLYTGNGSTVLYSISFPYIDEADVKATLNGTATTAFVFANASTIQFTTAPANGVAIRIYRETQDADNEATFYPGSSIKADDLNDNFTQSIYIAQETRNTANGVFNLANAALPRTGGTMTGPIVFAAGQPTATDATAGIVRLADATNDSSPTKAVSANALKTTFDAVQERSRFDVRAALIVNTPDTQINFTSIPNWADRAVISFVGVSGTSAATGYTVQLGSSAGVETTGYVSSAVLLGATSGSYSSTSSILIGGPANASQSITGTIDLVRQTSTMWVASFQLMVDGVGTVILGNAYKALSGTLTSIRVSTTSGTFDVGLIGLQYSGI
jgi:hypothetical protein